MTLYLFDTNAISDMIALHPLVARRVAQALADGDELGLVRPCHYEVLRGLFWRGATAKLQTYLGRVVPLMNWIEMIDADWEQAARFWSFARQNGKQLGDPDLLLAAVTHRLNAVVVSADADFDALTILRKDWRSQLSV
jgi:predicted nucleic acid-binding protein